MSNLTAKSYVLESGGHSRPPSLTSQLSLATTQNVTPLGTITVIPIPLCAFYLLTQPLFSPLSSPATPFCSLSLYLSRLFHGMQTTL